MGQELPLCPIDGLFQSTEVKEASFPIFASLDMEIGRPFICLREASTPPPPPPLPASKESQDRWAVYLTRNPCILASTPFYSTLKAVLYFLSVGTGNSASHWLHWTILHSNQAAQTQIQWKVVMEHTGGGLSVLHCAEGEGYVRRPKDSKRENPAEFLYSVYYTSFTRRIYELEKKKFTLVGFLFWCQQSLSPLKSPPSWRAWSLCLTLRPLQPCWIVWY